MKKDVMMKELREVLHYEYYVRLIGLIEDESYK